MEFLDIMPVSVQDMLLIRAIARHGSVSRAAQEVRVSQPTASYRLNKLREIFEDPIFVGVNRKMMPTSKGAQLVNTFATQITALKKLVEPEVFDPVNTNRTFTILANGFLMPALLASLPSVFFAKTKNAKLQIETETSINLVDQQLHGHADFFAWIYSPQGAKGIRRLVSPRLKLMLHYDADFRDPPTTIEDFAKCRFVQLDMVRNTVSPIDIEMMKQGFGTRNVVCFAPTVESIVQIVAGTDLVYIGTAYNTQFGSKSFHTAEIPFKIPSLRHELRWSLSKEKDEGHKWMRKMLVDASGLAAKKEFRLDPNEDFIELTEYEQLDESLMLETHNYERSAS